jgi:hypothetical protein
MGERARKGKRLSCCRPAGALGGRREFTGGATARVSAKLSL